MAVTVTLPDGKALELPDGATGADAAAAIGPGLARAALAVAISQAPDDACEVRDLARPLPDGAKLSIITAKSGEPALELIRHDAAHVLAAAVMELYEGVKISIGPAIAEGFYYDFEFPAGTGISEEDFPKIEERMRAHIKAGESFERQDVSVTEARERFLAQHQDYKVELIDDLVAAAENTPNPLQTVSLYTNGPFTDLCRGPHAPSTASVGAFRLNSVAGAYWRGDSTRTMLTRIYGTAFFSKTELAEHLERIEQAKARDHRKLGRELGSVHLLRGLTRRCLLAAGGGGHLQCARAPLTANGPEPRLQRGQDATDLRLRAVEDIGPLGQVPPEHVHRRGRGAPDGR